MARAPRSNQRFERAAQARLTWSGTGRRSPQHASASGWTRVVFASSRSGRHEQRPHLYATLSRRRVEGGYL